METKQVNKQQLILSTMLDLSMVALESMETTQVNKHQLILSTNLDLSMVALERMETTQVNKQQLNNYKIKTAPTQIL